MRIGLTGGIGGFVPSGQAPMDRSHPGTGSNEAVTLVAIDGPFSAMAMSPKKASDIASSRSAGVYNGAQTGQRICPGESWWIDLSRT